MLLARRAEQKLLDSSGGEWDLVCGSSSSRALLAFKVIEAIACSTLWAAALRWPLRGARYGCCTRILHRVGRSGQRATIRIHFIEYASLFAQPGGISHNGISYVKPASAIHAGA